MDRPIGTPIVSRDGVSIASEIELECPFENMGAQVVREVSKQTNEVAGDGTTTATVLANFLVQNGLALLAEGANPVELVEGLELAVDETIEALKRSAKSLDGVKGLRAIASIAANDAKLGEIVAEAFERAGNHGIVAVEFGATVETTLEVIEGMAFERGYLSHHMVTDVERMQVVLDNPYILMTDQKIQSIDELNGVFSLIEKSRRPLLIIAEEVAPPVIMMLLSRREKDNFKVAAIHPPEYGHWRKAMLDDIAVTTGGKVISKDLGGAVERARLEDLGSARQVRISSTKTLITAGHGQAKGNSGPARAGVASVRRGAGKCRARQVPGASRQAVRRHGDDPGGWRNPGRAEAQGAIDRRFDQCDARCNRGGHCAGRRRRSDAGCAGTRRV